jgi:hypothetical protein
MGKSDTIKSIKLIGDPLLLVHLVQITCINLDKIAISINLGFSATPG